MAAAVSQAGGIAHDLIPSGAEVSDILSNVVLPATGGLMGYFFADFIGLEDIITDWVMSQVATTGKVPDAAQSRQMVWAVNGACIALYSVVLMIGLALWGSGHDFIGPPITGFGIGLIVNKLVDIFSNRAK